MENKEWCVYCHTNIINNKKYIGITSSTPSRRWRKDGIGYKNCVRFYNSILKHGWDNFKHDILFDNLTEAEAKSKEIELILKQRTEFGKSFCYNITDGGDGAKRKWSEEEKLLKREKYKKFGKPVIQIDFKGEVIKRWDSISDIQRYYDKNIGEISSCLNKRGNSNTSMGYIWIFEKEYDKENFNVKEYTNRILNNSIYQINKNNEIVFKYENIQDVMCKNPKYKVSTVYGVITEKDKITKKHKTAYGFTWEYEKNYNLNKDYSKYFIRENSKNKNKVNMIEIDTREIIRTFDSITEASKYVKCCPSNITACCKGRQKTVKGYIFEYILN